MVDGARLTDISPRFGKATRAAEVKFGRGFGIVSGYGGHGIGREMHLDPFLANEGKPNRGPLLVIGSTLAIEPMLTLGTTETSVLGDDWTVVTDDGSRAAHWEHTVVVTGDGPRISPRGRRRFVSRWSGHARIVTGPFVTFAPSSLQPQGSRGLVVLVSGLKRFGCLGVGIGGRLFVAAGILIPEEGRASLRADSSRRVRRREALNVVRGQSVGAGVGDEESPRTKPRRVRPESSARSAASDDGADTADSIGIPAITAFCTSSKLARPDTCRM